MEIHNLDTLIQSDAGEKNPFLLLPISPWFLRSMKPENLKSFIKDLKRDLSKYLHPDKFQDKGEYVRHEEYFKMMSDGIDRLLKDDFYFQQSLREVTSEDILYRYQDELSTEKAKSERLRKQLEELGLKIKGKDLVINSYERISHSLRNVESELTANTVAFPLVKGFGCRMNMGEYVLEDVKLCRDLDNLFSSDKKGLDLELEGRILVRESFERDYYTSEENKQGKRRKRQNPLFDVEVQGNIGKIIYRLGAKSESSNQVKIVGSLTYSAIKEYLRFFNQKLIQPKDSAKGVTRTGFGLTREFSFESLINNNKDENFSRISLFLSDFIFPETFLLTKRETGTKNLISERYRLVLPASISNIQYKG